MCYGHLYEDGAMMGAKLRALLKGEDVLTIDQTMITDRTPLIDSARNTSFPREFPFVLRDTVANQYFHLPIPVDYTIVNKLVHYSLNRPGYLFEDIEPGTVYAVPANKRKDCPCLFVAYFQNEYEAEKEKAIAVDIAFMKDNIQSRPLLLYKGTYAIIKKNKEGHFHRFEYVVK